MIEWYHLNLRHPGVTRTINSIRQNFGWKGMRKQVEAHIKSCDECQRNKIVGKAAYAYEELPLVPTLRDIEPWEKVHVDCTGHWTVHVTTAASDEVVTYKIHILAMLDACIGWPELTLISTANSKSCSNNFDINWLYQYPRPAEVRHNNGNEFMGEEFQTLLASYDIKAKPTTVKNPIAQSLVERLHLSIGDYLRTSIYAED